MKDVFIPCSRLSWLRLPVSFLLHVKYTLSYRMQVDFLSMASVLQSYGMGVKRPSTRQANI